jgi:hypothetical protein
MSKGQKPEPTRPKTPREAIGRLNEALEFRHLPGGWVTLDTAANECQVGKAAIYKRIREHHLQTARVGHTRLVRLAEVRLAGRYEV